MKKVAKMLALIAGAVLLVIGGLSFLPTGIVGPEGIMIRYAGVPWVYVASGVVLLGFSTLGESTAAAGLYTVAVAHLLLAGLGYSQMTRGGSALLFNSLRLTQADLILHGVVALTLIVCGKLNTARQQVIWE